MSIFDSVEKYFIKKSDFNLSHQSLLTGKMGKLIPILCEEVLPGDRFSIGTEAFVRFAPMLAPIMDKVQVSIHTWFCPNRILWKNWENFLTGGKDGTDEPAFPYMLFPDGISRSSLADYLGLPANSLLSGQEKKNIGANEKINALPFRAYAKIYNLFYRDEQLDDEVGLSDDDGEDTTTNRDLLTRAWNKDYFTSARPSQQLGDGVIVPLGDSAPVVGDGKTLGLTSKSGTNDRGLVVASDRILYGSGSAGSAAGSAVGSVPVDWDNNAYVGVSKDAEKSGLKADLSQSSSIDIVSLRFAFQLQKFKERAIRAGNRIKEFLLAHFGVKSSDARLQLPEYLGGSKVESVISEVIQTSQGTQDSPQGNLAGHGVAYNSGVQVKNRKFEDHGWIISILNIQPKAAYSQGIKRKFSKLNKFDYALPVFQHVGEQEILEKEIYGNASNPNFVFGFGPRYAEYKHHQNEFHGDFCGNMQFYHLGRFFENEPLLNSSFIKSNPSKRIFAVTDENVDELLIQCYHNIVARRSLDYFSDPGLVDHF